jgi:hypothetical protein
MRRSPSAVLLARDGQVVGAAAALLGQTPKDYVQQLLNPIAQAIVKGQWEDGPEVGPLRQFVSVGDKTHESYWRCSLDLEAFNLYRKARRVEKLPADRHFYERHLVPHAEDILRRWGEVLPPAPPPLTLPSEAERQARRKAINARRYEAIKFFEAIRRGEVALVED